MLCGETGEKALIYCWWECRMAFGNTYMHLYIHLPFNQAIPHLEIYFKDKLAVTQKSWMLFIRVYSQQLMTRKAPLSI